MRRIGYGSVVALSCAIPVLAGLRLGMGPTAWADPGGNAVSAANWFADSGAAQAPANSPQNSAGAPPPPIVCPLACNYICANDINGDRLVNTFDIDPFINCLIAGGCGRCR